jgi:hypothetical protein
VREQNDRATILLKTESDDVGSHCSSAEISTAHPAITVRITTGRKRKEKNWGSKFMPDYPLGTNPAKDALIKSPLPLGEG